MQKTDSSLDLQHIWLMICSFLVFSMQAGFLCLETGLTRSKNNINVALKNILDFVICIFIFWLVGYGISYGASWFGLIGTSKFAAFSHAFEFQEIAFFILQTLFCCTAVTIVSGAVAERVRFNAYILIGFVIALVFYPVFVHWGWSQMGGQSGWLLSLGFFDCAGSTVIHSIGGWMALATILIIGPRKGAINPVTREKNIQGYNLPIAILGTMILFIGWIGFNIGSTILQRGSIAYTFINTLLSGIAGGLAVYLYSAFRYQGKLLAQDMIVGVLSGLVSITASCYVVNPTEAICIGAIGGLIGLFTDRLLLRFNIDDAVGAIPVHLGAGIWGTIAVGLFGHPDRIGSGLSWQAQTGVQLIAVVVAFLWAFGGGYLILSLVNKFYRFRVTPEQEFIGLNISEHNAKNEVFEFISFLESQSKSGDLSLRANVESFTEIGMIAHQFNTMISSLEKTQLSLKNQKNNINMILQNMKQGIFTIDKDLIIQNEYSNFLESILDTKKIAGTSVINTLFKQSSLSLHDIDMLRTALEVSLNTPEINFRINHHLLAREISIQSFTGSEKVLEIDWEPICNEEDILIKLMVIVKDVTVIRELKGVAEKKETAVNLMAQFLACPGDRLKGILDDLRSFCDALPEKEEEYRTDPVYLTELLRPLHSMKGNCRLLGLTFLTEAIHQTEQYCCDLKSKRVRYNSEDYAQMISHIKKTYKEHIDLATIRVENGSQTFATDNNVNECIQLALHYRVDKKTGKETLEALVEKLSLAGTQALHEVIAEIPGRSVSESPRIFINDHQIRVNMTHRERLRDIFIHCYQNVSAHGVENGIDRLSMFIEVSELKNQILIKIFDNGLGIKKDQILSTNTEDKTLIDLSKILNDGFSTSPITTLISGRGIGMGTIRDLVSQLNGSFSIIPNHSKETESYLPFIIELNFSRTTPPIFLRPDLSDHG